MKNILLALLAAAVGATGAFSQEETERKPEIKFSGEVKTGIFWKEFQAAGDPVDTNTMLHSMDDAGGEGDQGRFRLNIDFDNGKNFGIRLRFQQQNFKEEYLKYSYAFGYGNFFNDQMTVAIGKLGGSPWGTGGPEEWKELETAQGGGMRVEWKPNFLPAGHQLNAGFVLNYYNAAREAAEDAVERQTLLNILAESVIGISYTHDYFMLRVAYRFDDPVDVRERGVLQAGDVEGGDMVYRVEERYLRTLLPGLSVWALGYLEGVTANKPDFRLFNNWLFAEYNPEMFTAQLRLGYRVVTTRSIFLVKPSFYWHFFDRLISAGVSFEYAQDFGDGKIWAGSPFSHIELEPKVQLNFSSSYIAFVYNWRQEYVGDSGAPNRKGEEPIKQTQRMNLRFCIYY
jgi:opacity protein-like surface antigen